MPAAGPLWPLAHPAMPPAQFGSAMPSVSLPGAEAFEHLPLLDQLLRQPGKFQLVGHYYLAKPQLIRFQPGDMGVKAFLSGVQ